MNTRRAQVYARDEKSQTGKAPPRGPKVLTIRDLSETKVIVPQEVHESNMAVVITVAVDGRLIPGLLPKNEVPAIRPITDLTRLQRARRLVSSLDVVQSKTSLVTEVKAQVVNELEERKIAPSQITLRPGAQAEIIKCRAYADALLENYMAFQNNSLNEKAVCRFAAATWFSDSFKIIDKYVVEAICGEASVKLLDAAFASSIPRSFFTKMTIKVAELKTQSIDDILFPRRLSRMMIIRKKEALHFNFPAELKESFSVLRTIAKFYHDDDDESVLYPIPPTFKDHFRNFTDLPQIDRSKADSTTLSITLLQMMFAAIPPKALTLETLSLHEGSFLTLIPQELTDEELAKASRKFDLDYDPDLTQSLKVQYKDYFLASDALVKGFRIRNLAKIFFLKKEEVEILPPIIWFHDSVNLEAFPAVKSMFDPNKPKTISADSKIAERFRMFKPTSAKKLNSGAPSSELTRNAKKFIKSLEKAEADSIFIENVRSYLFSFVNQSFQDLAVKVMAASLQAREITIIEDDIHVRNVGDRVDDEDLSEEGDETFVGLL